MAASITETPNELTRDIDLTTPVEFLRVLRQTDAQIFNGYLAFPGFFDEVIVEKIADAVEQTRELIYGKTKSVIILSGAGTSGRLSMLAAKTCNQILDKKNLKNARFVYLIAGDNKALIAAQEGSEDDARQSIIDLEKAIGNAKSVGYIGITCGFSAPYVAGQLDYMLNKLETKKLKGYAGLIGFNPVERSRSVPIEGWDKTFMQVAKHLESSKYGIILNPIVGPEPITGSTRMKSGSATKILLDIVFQLALDKKQKDLPGAIRQMIKHFEETRIAVYRDSQPLAEVIAAAGNALTSKGHIYYLGKAPWSILSLVDASECPPTFGASFEDVRGFVEGGWNTLLGKGQDLSSLGDIYRVGVDEFIKTKLPKLTENDIVILLGEGEPSKILSQKPVKGWDYVKLFKQAKKSGATTAMIAIQSKSSDKAIKKNPTCDLLVSPVIPYNSFCKELGTKLMLNAITTGAHILAGKIYQNRMIDMKISNNKLYFRTIQIIASIMRVSEDTARTCMLKSIYETDKLTEQIESLPVSTHIQNATSKTKVVPRALLMATGKFDYYESSDAITKEPIIRHIIQKWVG